MGLLQNTLKAMILETAQQTHFYLLSVVPVSGSFLEFSERSVPARRCTWGKNRPLRGWLGSDSMKEE